MVKSLKNKKGQNIAIAYAKEILILLGDNGIQYL